jgi:hypothetical protein
MALSPIDAHCEHCGMKFTAQPKRSFLAFQKLTCPTCDQVTTYPLTNGYRNIYWGLVVLTVLVFFVRLTHGEFRPLGWLGMLAIFALFRDGRIRANFGSTPKNYSLLLSVTAILLTITFIGSIVATAFPAYQHYLNRAEIEQVAEPAGDKLDGQTVNRSNQERNSQAQGFDSSLIASRSEKLFDSEWLNTYLSKKIPGSAIMELSRQRDNRNEYRVLPSRIKYKGSAIKGGNESPAYMMIQTKKQCAWRVDMDMNLFMGVEDSILRMDVKMAIDEKLNAMEAFEQIYSEAAIVPSFDADDGKVFEQSIEKYGVKKTQNGVQVDFEEPEVRSAIGNGDILLTVESDQFMLDMMRRGTNSYSYMLLDADLPMLYSKEDVLVTKYSDTRQFGGMGLWHRRTKSNELLEGVWHKSMEMNEVLNSLGVALYFGFDDPDLGEIQFYLQEVEFLEPETCGAEVVR